MPLPDTTTGSVELPAMRLSAATMIVSPLPDGVRRDCALYGTFPLDGHLTERRPATVAVTYLVTGAEPTVVDCCAECAATWVRASADPGNDEWLGQVPVLRCGTREFRLWP